MAPYSNYQINTYSGDATPSPGNVPNNNLDPFTSSDGEKHNSGGALVVYELPTESNNSWVDGFLAQPEAPSATSPPVDVPSDILESQSRALANIGNFSSVRHNQQVSNALVTTNSARADQAYDALVPFDTNQRQQQFSTVVVPAAKSGMTGQGDESVHPLRKEMKSQRKIRTAGGAIGGAVVGGLVLGPVGAVLGGYGGGIATNKICKHGERRAQRKHEKENFQRGAARSVVHTGSFV